jgi:hypothetical protein
MENAVKFYGHLLHFMVICKNFMAIWPLCNVVVIWYILSHFGMLCQEPCNTALRHDHLVNPGSFVTLEIGAGLEAFVAQGAVVRALA